MNSLIIGMDLRALCTMKGFMTVLVNLLGRQHLGFFSGNHVSFTALSINIESCFLRKTKLDYIH